MSVIHPFRAAVEARDLDRVVATLAPDVVFHTPIRFKPFDGPDQVRIAMSLAADAFVFQPGFRYVHDMRDENTLALFFQAHIGDRMLDGVDFVRLDAEDRVTELKVMMRPFSAVQALVGVTGEALQRYGA